MSVGSEEAATLYRLAQQDRLAFVTLIANQDIELRIACFHGQQAVEKFFKAVLANAGVAFPPTHNLLKLGELVEATTGALPVSIEALKRLNPYAVALRYDDREVHTLSGEDAKTIVDAVATWATELLGYS